MESQCGDGKLTQGRKLRVMSGSMTLYSGRIPLMKSIKEDTSMAAIIMVGTITMEETITMVETTIMEDTSTKVVATIIMEVEIITMEDIIIIMMIKKDISS